MKYDFLQQQYIQDNKNMFNTHTYERRLLSNKQQQQEQQSLTKWTNRYKTQVQPYLVGRYERRINGFAKKMQDEPVVLKIRKDGRTDDILARKYDKKLNLGEDNFRFKSQPSSSIKNKNNTNFSNSNNSKLFQSIQSQSRYSKAKVQYRSRDKDKQINPPMKYTNKNSQLVLHSILLPKMKNSSQSRNRANQTQIINSTSQHAKKRTRKNSIFVDDDYQVPENLSYGDIQTSTIYNSHVNRKNQNIQKSQIQIIQQEEMKALAQRKLYFKSLIDLQQSVKTAKQRNNLRQILTKCGVFKPISGKLYQQQQVDRFLQLMKTKQW